MIETIEKAAQEGRLTTVTCKDRVTNEEVEVLCLKRPGGVIPIAKLYVDSDIAMAELTTPGGKRDTRVLH